MGHKPNSIFEAAQAVLSESKLSEAAAQKLARQLYSKHLSDAHHLGNLLIQLAVNKGKFDSEKKRKPLDYSGYSEPGRSQAPTTGW